MKKLSLYNDSDIGYMDEEFLEIEVQNPVEEYINEKKLLSENESENEEESEKIS